MILHNLKHAVMITSFVLIMMLLIEYLNIQTQGKWQKILKASRWGQYVFSAFLGVIPGCLGAFTVVSLYSHGIISFGALVTTMIATSGDEAFVMFSMFPLKATVLTFIIFIIGIVVGYLTDFILKNHGKGMPEIEHTLEIHKNDSCQCFPKGEIINQLKNISFQRALLIGILVSFLILLFADMLGAVLWNWKKTTFVLASLIALFIVSTVPDHFLEDHLWKHVIKKHLLRIFLWTFGALLIIHFANSHLDLNQIINNHPIIVLMVAVLIGIIPESGPHLVFVTLYASGKLPFSILLASSIVQDGHGMLPMLAVSKRDFLLVKFINIIIGFLIGMTGLMLSI